MIAIGSGSLLVLLVLAIAAYRFGPWRALPAREAVPVTEKHAMTRDAFAAGASPASDQESRDLSAALDQLHAAMQPQGGPALQEDTTAADFYADPDIGPALAAPGFAAWCG